MTKTNEILDRPDDEIDELIHPKELFIAILTAILTAFLFQRLNEFFRLQQVYRYLDRINYFYYFIGFYFILRFLFRFILRKDNTYSFFRFLFIALGIFFCVEFLSAFYHYLLDPESLLYQANYIAIVVAILIVLFITQGLMIDLKKGRPVLGILFTAFITFLFFILVGAIALMTFGMG